MCMAYTILWLKMVSYVQVNYWCRQKRHKTKKMSECLSVASPAVVVHDHVVIIDCYIVEDNDYIKKQNLVWYPDNLNYRGMFVSPTAVSEAWWGL